MLMILHLARRWWMKEQTFPSVSSSPGYWLKSTMTAPLLVEDVSMHSTLGLNFSAVINTTHAHVHDSTEDLISIVLVRLYFSTLVSEIKCTSHPSVADHSIYRLL
jgi:hypothetical protein